MRPIDFFPKLDDSAGHRSRPTVNPWPLGISAALLFALSWVLQRFAQTPHALMVGASLAVLAAVLFLLLRQSDVVTASAKSEKPAERTGIAMLTLGAADNEVVTVAARKFSAPLTGPVTDEAWADAVASYESAIRRLAAGKPGSRTEAQRSALELARLQGLLLQASQPHLPLGLEAAWGITAGTP